jgi:PhnB protein
MAVETYINFNGNCREAVEFYRGVFGTEKPVIMLFGDIPPDGGFPMSEETKKLVMHTEIKVKGSTIMFSDVPSDMPYVAGNNISLVYRSNAMDEIKSIFSQLKVDGTVMMELQETFWSKCYGFVIDQFGIGWQLSYESE